MQSESSYMQRLSSEQLQTLLSQAGPSAQRSAEHFRRLYQQGTNNVIASDSQSKSMPKKAAAKPVSSQKSVIVKPSSRSTSTSRSPPNAGDKQPPNTKPVASTKVAKSAKVVKAVNPSKTFTSLFGTESSAPSNQNSARSGPELISDVSSQSSGRNDAVTASLDSLWTNAASASVVTGQSLHTSAKFTPNLQFVLDSSEFGRPLQVSGPTRPAAPIVPALVFKSTHSKPLFSTNLSFDTDIAGMQSVELKSRAPVIQSSPIAPRSAKKLSNSSARVVGLSDPANDPSRSVHLNDLISNISAQLAAVDTAVQAAAGPTPVNRSTQQSMLFDSSTHISFSPSTSSEGDDETNVSLPNSPPAIDAHVESAVHPSVPAETNTVSGVSNTVDHAPANVLNDSAGSVISHISSHSQADAHGNEEGDIALMAAKLAAKQSKRAAVRAAAALTAAANAEATVQRALDNITAQTSKLEARLKVDQQTESLDVDVSIQASKLRDMLPPIAEPQSISVVSQPHMARTQVPLPIPPPDLAGAVLDIDRDAAIEPAAVSLATDPKRAAKALVFYEKSMRTLAQRNQAQSEELKRLRAETSEAKQLAERTQREHESFVAQAEVRATDSEQTCERLRALLHSQMDDERNRLNSQPELVHAHRTATERRFWDKIATEQLLQKSQPPTEFPTFAVQPHDAEAYRRAMLQLKAAQKEVKVLTSRNLELESKLSDIHIARAQELKDNKAQLQRQHVHLSGAVRRIHWLLFERAKAEAEKKERETYVQRLEHRLLQKAAQVNALQQKLAVVEKVDKLAAAVKPTQTSNKVADKKPVAALNIHKKLNSKPAESATVSPQPSSRSTMSLPSRLSADDFTAPTSARLSAAQVSQPPALPSLPERDELSTEELEAYLAQTEQLFATSERLSHMPSPMALKTETNRLPEPSPGPAMSDSDLSMVSDHDRQLISQLQQTSLIPLISVTPMPQTMPRPQPHPTLPVNGSPVAEEPPSGPHLPSFQSPLRQPAPKAMSQAPPMPVDAEQDQSWTEDAKTQFARLQQYQRESEQAAQQRLQIAAAVRALNDGNGTASVQSIDYPERLMQHRLAAHQELVQRGDISVDEHTGPVSQTQKLVQNALAEQYNM